MLFILPLLIPRGMLGCAPRVVFPRGTLGCAPRVFFPRGTLGCAPRDLSPRGTLGCAPRAFFGIISFKVLQVDWFSGVICTALSFPRLVYPKPFSRSGIG